MTVQQEGQRLRAEVAQLARGQGHKYPPDLRRRVLDWVDRARSDGMSESWCGMELGLKKQRFEYWRRIAKRDEPRELVQVGVREELPFGPGLSFATPRGYRLEGLTMDQAVALLRVFA